MTEFNGKVILITGAGKGLGRLLALAFAAQGACVAANDLTPINLDGTLQLIHEQGGCAREYLFDVSNRMQAQALVDQVLLDWNRLDILVNNAAVRPYVPLLDLDEWDWRRTLDVNLSGPFFLVQSAGRVMQSSGGGIILNLGAAGLSNAGLEGLAAYTSSKYGLHGLTMAAACELAPHQIRVNLLCPFEALPDLQPDSHELALSAEWLAQAQRAGFQHASPLVSLALFLSSSAAATITGQLIPCLS
jgi:NAD(P)-dependent dehydrogenase (short-subunit alcohol dehydrogenase family)